MDVLTADMGKRAKDTMDSIKCKLKGVEDALVQVVWMLGFRKSLED